MDFDQDNKSQGGDLQNIQDMLDGLGLGDDAANYQVSKKDSTVFIIDCSQYMLKTFQGQDKCQLQQVLQGYYNFLQRKIIANSSDKVGLILYNVGKSQNSINQQHIYKVHSLDSQVDAKRIKQASLLFKQFQTRFGGLSSKKVSLNYVLWQYGAQISNLKQSDYHLRVFLFTAQDNPHPIGDEDRAPSIKRSIQLSAKGVIIQLFPIRKAKRCSFDVRKFYQEVISFDPEEINQTVMDSSSKILDLQQRLRQKQYKKRTLNRLVLKIGKQLQQKQNGQKQQKLVQIGIKVYSLFNKAKKPTAKKVDAKTNKLLQRVTKKLNNKGQVLFDGSVGTYYPLGGQKIKITKQDMNKIKNSQSPGMTLLGFKPKNLIKTYHNIRTSYFLYPDQQHIQGSSQFMDALISQLSSQNLVGIVKIVPRNNNQLRFAALLPQQQKYDEDDHFQTPPGFNMIILPFAQDIINFSGDKTICQPQQISKQLVNITKLLIQNLTIKDFDFRDFQCPSLQKFYSHLQAHALSQKDVTLRPDLLEPDIAGFNKHRDIIDLVRQTVMMECQQTCKGFSGCSTTPTPYVKQEDEGEVGVRRGKAKTKKQYVKEQHMAKSKSSKSMEVEQVKEEDNIDSIAMVESMILDARLKELKVADLKNYLISHGLNEKGKKQTLIDRVLQFMEHKNSI